MKKISPLLPATEDRGSKDKVKTAPEPPKLIEKTDRSIPDSVRISLNPKDNLKVTETDKKEDRPLLFPEKMSKILSSKTPQSGSNLASQNSQRESELTHNPPPHSFTLPPINPKSQNIAPKKPEQEMEI